MIREIWKAFKRYWAPTLDKIEALDLTIDRIALDAEINKRQSAKYDGGFPVSSPKVERDFAVTARPRHVPWSIRRKELEQAARQKRRQLESFREQA